MKLGTYINAAIEARLDLYIAERTYGRLIDDGQYKKADEIAFPRLERKARQRTAFHARAIQLADERDELIALQNAELDGFARVMAETEVAA